MSKNTSSSGLGLSSVLTLIFIVLKLCDVITWSWWWVLSPLLINIGLTILILVIVYVVYAICENKEYRNASKKGKNDKWKF